MSHLIADGWSVRVLLHELKLLYEADGSRRHLAWSRRSSFQTTVKCSVRRHIRRWLLVRRPIGGNSSTRIRRIWTCRETDLDPLGAAIGRHGSPFAGILSSTRASRRPVPARAPHPHISPRRFNVLLCRLSGQEDLVVGVPAAGQIAGSLTGWKGGERWWGTA